MNVENEPPRAQGQALLLPSTLVMLRLLSCLSMALLFCATPLAAREHGFGASPSSRITGDWAVFSRTAPVSTNPAQVQVTDMTGTQVNNKTWKVVHTQYFDLHYQSSSNLEKVRRLARSMDNIYTFLQGRLGVNRPTPIRAFLIPGVVGHSVSYAKWNMVHTGDAGDYVLNMGSLLHECAHLFALQYLGEGRHSKWTGEYMCHYLQTRLRILERGGDFKQQYRATVDRRPLPPLSVLENSGKSPDYSSAAMFYYFLEERYGADKLNDFWRARMDADRRASGREAFEIPFQKVFNKTGAELESEWRVYWGQAAAPSR